MIANSAFKGLSQYLAIAHRSLMLLHETLFYIILENSTVTPTSVDPILFIGTISAAAGTVALAIILSGFYYYYRRR